MIVRLPEKYFEERSYVINQLFGRFLNFSDQVDIIKDEECSAVIFSFGSAKLIIEDHFFNHFDGKADSYLNSENIPTEVCYLKTPFSEGENIPVLFGKPIIEQSESCITLSCDIIADIFFYLSRWEEYCVSAKDKHNRFEDNKSIIVQFGLELRPVVNELTFFIKNLLIHLGLEPERINLPKFQIIPTHDVDFITYWTIKRFFTRIVGGVLKLNFERIWVDLKSYLKTLINKENDPFNTFEWLIAISKKYQLTSRFNMMATLDANEYEDGSYLNRADVRKLINLIQFEQQVIGFHPGYYTYNNTKLFAQQFNQLKDATEVNILEGRQHFLRFEIPETYNIWQQNSLKVDSSLGYAKRIGYRASCCWDFNPFDFLNKKELSLIERPLIVMDQSIYFYNKANIEQYQRQAMLLKETTKKFGGNFVVLWHNSALDLYEFKGARKFYEKLVS